MGISNEWQLINELTYIAIDSSVNYLSEESIRKIATAIGWEVVNVSDYTDTISGDGHTYSSHGIYGMRPLSDDEDYNTFVTIGEYYRTSSDVDGLLVFELSTGQLISKKSRLNNPASLLLLRPFAQGAFALKNGIQTEADCIFDRFYNPKTGKTKWGIKTNSRSFVDLYTGLTFTLNNETSTMLIKASAIGGSGYIALKKCTILCASPSSNNGLYNAMSLYQSYIDYSTNLKTIELNGVTYCGVSTNSGSGSPYYIELAE